MGRLKQVTGLLLALVFGTVAVLFIVQPAFAAVTLLTDGFESNFDKWTDGGTTDWDRATSQKHSGSYSAHAGSSDNDLISDNLNTGGRSSITIAFWYRDDDIDDSDDIYLQLYNGSAYANKFELGNSTEDTWNQCQVTINNSGSDTQYFRSNFRIKFEGTSIDSGENLWIDDVTVTVSDITLPAAPTGLTATAVSSSQINLSWTDNSTNEDGFMIERKTGAGGTYAQIDTVGAGITTYQNTGLTAATNYYYQVRAYNAGGNSGYSNEANATTQPTAPSAPSGLGATAVSSTQINLSWTDNSNNEDGFKIERKTGAGGTYAQIDTVGAGITTYQNTGLSASIEYYYRVRAYNAGGNSGYSNEANATTTLPGKFWEWECNVNPTTLDSNSDAIGDWVVRGQNPGTGFSGNLTTDGGLTVYTGGDTLDARPLYDATDADLAMETKWKSLNDDTVNNWNSMLWWNLDYTGGQMGRPWCWVNRSGGNTVIHMQNVTGGSSSDITVSGIGYFTMRWQINTVANTLAVYINGEGSPRQTYNYTLAEEAVSDKFPTLSLGNGRGYIDYVHVYAGDYALMPPSTLGTILREWWEGISGASVSNLTASPNYPNDPTGRSELTSLEGPSDWADNYGTRIRGYIYPPASGDYTFWIASDDSSELWLSTTDNPANASLIANVPEWTSSRQWTKYSQQQSSPKSLTAGQKYYIEALQKEGTGGDNVAVAWQGPGISREVIDGSYLSPWWTGIGMGKGLIGNYYDNMDFTNPKVSRVDPTVNFDWGNGSPNQWMGVDTFSVRWAGQVQPKYSETYTFYTNTDDGVRLWVNNQLLIDKWIDQGQTEWSGTIALTVGIKYNIKMEYYENGGGAVAQLSWSSSSQPKELIPQSQLYSSEAPPLYDWAVDGERILNPNGTINWSEYEYVAHNIDQVWVRDYFFGPTYSYYHPTPETIPTMYCNSNADGWHLGGQTRQPTGDEFVEWYSEGGQFVLSRDVGAPTAWQPGVVQCWDGGMWGFKDPILPAYSLLNHLTYDSVMSQNGSLALPDPGPVSQDWLNASGGTVPAPPVTVVRTHGAAGVTGFMIYKNGLIGVCGTGNDYYHWGVAGYTRTCIKLPDGKVPTAAAVAGCNEFLLVTVWDAANQKGQLAVIAIKGPVVRTFDCMPHEDRPCFWGIPNWPGVKAMKLLGYVDLPFAAPMAIKISQDFVAGNGRGNCENTGMNLDSQAERDTWYNWSGVEGKKTARCGYAVVSSRAENKVAFIDLQPLFQYYRTMYFTTQANYDQTKIEGAADNQWPYTFAYAAGQTPTVYATINVTQPTAVAAGLPWCMWLMRNGNAAMENAYVTTMDGNLLMYKVGDLMTTASGGSIGAPFNTVAIGKNPSSLDYGHGCAYGDDLFITCRGDNAVYYLYSDGSTRGVLRDSRITDAVSACGSGVGRCFRNACWHAPLLHLMDFRGRKVLNYRFHCGYPDDDSIPVGNPPNPPNQSTIFEFSGEQSPPGYPFLFVRAEVI